MPKYQLSFAREALRSHRMAKQHPACTPKIDHFGTSIPKCQHIRKTYYLLHFSYAVLLRHHSSALVTTSQSLQRPCRWESPSSMLHHSSALVTMSHYVTTSHSLQRPCHYVAITQAPLSPRRNHSSALVTTTHSLRRALVTTSQ